MLEFDRGDLAAWRNKLRLFSCNFANVKVQLQGNPSKILIDNALVERGSVDYIIDNIRNDVDDTIVTFFMYDEREYEYFTNVLGFSENSFNTRVGMLPYSTYREHIDIDEPVFSVYQSLTDSTFDTKLFQRMLKKNGFRYNVGNNVFCTDIHFYSVKDYNRYKLIMGEYAPPSYWFEPYVNPGYFKRLFGEY